MSCSVDRLAILKILLHAAKYPSASINGVLLGREAPRASDGEAAIHIVDAIPLFHSFLTLAPSLETALLQVWIMIIRQMVALPPDARITISTLQSSTTESTFRVSSVLVPTYL